MEVYGVDKAANPTAARIAAAARELLVSEGADAVSMRRVAQAVGLTPMAIYRHFASREVLLRQVADATFAEIAHRWGATVRDGSIEDRVDAALNDYLDFALDQPQLYQFLFGERREDARMFPDDFRARRSPTLNILAGLLTEGIQAGLFRDDDVWELAITVAAFLHGFVALYHGGRIGLPEKDFRALCRASTRRLFDGIKA